MPRVGHEQGGTDLAHLIYGGKEYPLDEEQLKDFLEKVTQVLESDAGVGLVEAFLHHGVTLAVTVSKEIPLAAKWFANEDEKVRPKAVTL
jgi:hypothetical protein